MIKSEKSSSEFVFSRHDDIGAAGAEDDTNYLAECYVDTGDLDVLMDCSNPRSIIVGRTGSGKTALLKELEKRSDNVITLSPHSLSLNYIANSKTIAFFENAGVNLSVFYGLLWKHILVVELLKSKFNIVDESGQRAFSNYIRGIITKKNKNKELAVDYLENWGNKFWLTAEQRMKELTSKVESDLSGSIQGKITGVAFTTTAAKALSSEERTEIVEHGQRAVSEVQIRELDNIFVVLEEDIFSDSQEPYYLAIDMLDEEWVDNRVKLQLIKSLIDTVRRFRRLSNVKVLIAMRRDLLEEVIFSTHDAGFQEEKYKSLYLYLRWTPALLAKVIETRLSLLVRKRYTKSKVKFEDLFVAKVGKTKKSMDYILDRTLLRPRDAILYVNACLAFADGQRQITAHTIREAEEEYSRERLKSLSTEWLAQHPNLIPIAQMITGFAESFRVSELTQDRLEEKFIEVSLRIPDPMSDPLSAQINKLTSDNVNFESVRAYFVIELYKLGILGLKPTGSSSVNWFHLSRTSVGINDVRGNSTVFVHPMYHRALDIHRAS